MGGSKSCKRCGERSGEMEGVSEEEELSGRDGFSSWSLREVQVEKRDSLSTQSIAPN